MYIELPELLVHQLNRIVSQPAPSGGQFGRVLIMGDPIVMIRFQHFKNQIVVCFKCNLLGRKNWVTSARIHFKDGKVTKVFAVPQGEHVETLKGYIQRYVNHRLERLK